MERLTIAVAVDTSGSLNTEDFSVFVQYLKKDLKRLGTFDLYLWMFDTFAINPKKFTEDTIDELDDYTLHYGGGTSFTCNWLFMKDTSTGRPAYGDELTPNFQDTSIKPDRFIMFTDGYGEDPTYYISDAGDYAPTTFVIRGGDIPKHFNFGKFIILEDLSTF